MLLALAFSFWAWAFLCINTMAHFFWFWACTLLWCTNTRFVIFTTASHFCYILCKYLLSLVTQTLHNIIFLSGLSFSQEDQTPSLNTCNKFFVFSEKNSIPQKGTMKTWADKAFFGAQMSQNDHHAGYCNARIRENISIFLISNNSNFTGRDAISNSEGLGKKKSKCCETHRGNQRICWFIPAKTSRAVILFKKYNTAWIMVYNIYFM